MKKFKYLSFAALVAAISMVACTPTETPDPDNGGKEPGEEPVIKSSECKLLTLKAVCGAKEYEAKIYDRDKVAEITYLGEDVVNLSSAVLVATVSDKATTNLTEAAVDLISTKPEIVVTAEDGTTTQKYTVEAVAATVSLKCEPVWDKTAGSFNMSTVCPAGSSVAFAGTDHIVFANGEIYDLDGKKTGKLNLDAYPGAKIYNLNNDVNGVVIANICFDAAGNATISADEVSYGYALAWKDGTDKAPIVLYSNAESESKGNAFAYMNCGGDINGDFILTMITNGRGATTCHHCFEFHNGTMTWNPFYTDYVSNDGNWGQIVAPCTGSINGTFFIGDSRGNNLGYIVYVRHGIQNLGEDVTLWGTTWPDGLVPDGVPEGNNYYGNYSTGNVKGFQFNGTNYVAVASTGWPKVYLTIQSDDPTDEENHYLLRTQEFDAAQQVPSVAYVYDPASDTGHIIVLAGVYDVARYDITREIL